MKCVIVIDVGQGNVVQTELQKLLSMTNEKFAFLLNCEEILMISLFPWSILFWILIKTKE